MARGATGVTIPLMDRPSGTVTFLFTDIVGSTRMWEADQAAMSTALVRHDALLRSAITEHGGRIFSTSGDGLAAAFARAGDALWAAIDAESDLGGEQWPQGAAIRVRMAMHTGEVVERGGDYFGTTVNQAARIMGSAMAARSSARGRPPGCSGRRSFCLTLASISSVTSRCSTALPGRHTGLSEAAHEGEHHWELA